MGQAIVKNRTYYASTPDKGSHIIYDNTSSGRTSQTVQGAIDKAFDEIDLMNEIIASGGIVLTQDEYNTLKAAGQIDATATYYLTNVSGVGSDFAIDITKAEYDLLTEEEKTDITYFVIDYIENGSTNAELKADFDALNTTVTSLSTTVGTHTTSLNNALNTLTNLTNDFVDISSQCSVTFVNGTLTSYSGLVVLYRKNYNSVSIKFYINSITGSASSTFMNLTLPTAVSALFTKFGSLLVQSGSSECNGVSPRGTNCYIASSATNIIVSYLGTATLSANKIWGHIEVW